MGRLYLAGTAPEIDKAIDSALARAGFQVIPLDKSLAEKWEQAKKDGNAVAAAGATLGGVRIDSGALGVLARQVRAQLDQLGATQTRIVVSGDLDEFSLAAVRSAPG